MQNTSFLDKLWDSIEYYYQHNPDTLMPLLMLTLATDKKIRIVTDNDVP